MICPAVETRRVKQMAERGEIQDGLGSVSSPGISPPHRLPAFHRLAPFGTILEGEWGGEHPAFPFAPMQAFFGKAAPWAGVSRGSRCRQRIGDRMIFVTAPLFSFESVRRKKKNSIGKVEEAPSGLLAGLGRHNCWESSHVASRKH